MKIDDGALEAAVRLSVRYLNDRYLPDKAIDLIDEACASYRLKKAVSKDNKIKAWEKQKQELYDARENALIAGDLDLAREVRSQEKALQEKLEKEYKKEARREKKEIGRAHV